MRAMGTLKRELRHCPVMFDPDVTDFNSLIEKLVSAWVQGGYIDRALENGLKLALHKPHRHVHEGKIPRPVSVGSNLLAVKERGLAGSSVSLQSLESYASEREGAEHNSNEDVSEMGSQKGTPKTSRKNTKFQRKIPKNAVATNILIGELTCLRRPLMGLVRLNPSRHLGWLCEVRLATQFVFICLVPDIKSETNYDVREVGRCIGTLMIDPIFREVAENCSSRFELLAGISEFVSNMTALPSCVWDSNTRIEPPARIPSQDFRRISKKTQEEKEKHVENTMIEHEEEEPELKRSGRLFGGLIADIKRKLPWYGSDFRDCLHVQCFASTIFLFLATLTPNVTFGGLLGQGTEQYMGTMECILAAAICGVVYALFAGQPMNILGSTGPMLVLEMIIFQYCKDHEWEFLPFRVWIGLWTTFILLVIVAFDLSSLVKFITRFTEECFASLIGIIFIYEAFVKVIKISSTHPVHFGSIKDLPTCPSTEPAPNEGNKSLLLALINNITDTLTGNTTTPSSLVNSTTWPTTTTLATINTTGHTGTNCHSYVGDVFFLSILEFLFTFGIAFFLVKFRNSIFFPNVIRQMLSDFGVLIAIVVVVGVDAALNIDTPKLTVPDKFSPTRPDREWFIGPIHPKNPWWLAIAALLPALLATILVFMDQQITAVIVNRKEHKLKKGCGYHLDIMVLAILITVMSVLGLPWYVAATVSALAHIMSLKVESDCTAPGEKPEFLGVREQRVTSLLVGILSGLSVFLTGVLKFIPLPVLYGIFLFMGVRSLEGMQLVDRFMLYLISPKYQPDYPYLRHVPLLRVHIFTLIQILCLAGLWIIKAFKETSIGFPIMVLATCFIRKLLDCFFTQYELSWLDHILPPLSPKKTKNSTSYSPNERPNGIVPEISIDQPIEMIAHSDSSIGPDHSDSHHNSNGLHHFKSAEQGNNSHNSVDHSDVRVIIS
ncbi:electroneutral sodium bicarbonate exchanger 1-like [Physella acuta]|uniref:electroneutral sodium bicarbonate exchanger 1-like n=1 Tax=Physella acuta TaxID=109671 RepID=UPI0027DC5B94|nr:electroneutral sodium bicarbonate exchanger 1-like [Physella acuta]